MILLLFIVFAYSYELPEACLKGKYDSTKDFTACNYNFYSQDAKDTPLAMETKILYDRSKCTTCCRVMFVSDYNYKTGEVFTKQNDIDGHTRYAMDQEFDDVNNVRNANGNYEQCILARPIEPGKTNQYWEFAPYMMYISYNIPRRVHDIRGGANKNSRLIIWKKKAPLDPGTNNQRFIYIHPYDDNYYPSAPASNYYVRGRDFKKHFFIPFQTSAKLCYSILAVNAESKTTADDKSNHVWTGNKDYKFQKTNAYQIRADTCNKDDAKQKWVPVFV